MRASNVNKWMRRVVTLCFVLTLLMFYNGYYHKNWLSLKPASYVLTNTYYKESNSEINSTIKYKNKGTEPMVILITDGAGQPSNTRWPFSVFPAGKLSPKRCPLQSHCVVTHDRHYKNKIDAIVSHNYDINWLKTLKAERLTSPFVFFRVESNSNTPGMGPQLDNSFSFTATFRKDSDIHMPYCEVHPIPLEEQSKKQVNYAEGKTKTAIVFMSNCVEFRFNFIQNLKKYMDISFYGKCSGSSCDPECESIQKSHKFFLSLENTYCTDYVTEKFYGQGLLKGLVPVVISGAKTNDIKIAPPKSFINILDFKNTKELADYLLYLDKNDTAYNEYHQWRKEYRIIWHEYVCSTCKRLWELKNEGRFGKGSVKLSEFWSSQKHCIGYDNKMFQKYLT